MELKRDTWLSPEATVRTPDDAVNIIHDMLRDMDREMLVCINMAASGRVINASICSVGTMDMALVSPPEILRGALLSGARSLIMLHNHPSGQISPSKEDMSITKRMATASAVVGVNFLDSIVCCRRSCRFRSARSSAPRRLSGYPPHNLPLPVSPMRCFLFALQRCIPAAPPQQLRVRPSDRPAADIRPSQP